MVVAVAATTVLAACKKKDEPIVQHDTTYEFNQDNAFDVCTSSKIKASADSAQVRYVYLLTTGTWVNFGSKNIPRMIDLWFKPAIEVSPKVKGKGNFEFKPGIAAPADSLWFVQNGWTVNQ